MDKNKRWYKINCLYGQPHHSLTELNLYKFKWLNLQDVPKMAPLM